MSDSSLPMVRGSNQRSLSGMLTFIALRAADPVLQYTLFEKGYAANALVRVGILNPARTLVSGNGIGPVPTLLMGMYSVAAFRHCYWVTFTNDSTYFPPSASLFVGAYNAVASTFNTFVAAYTLSKASPLLSIPADSFEGWASALGWHQWVGLGMFAAGITMEIVAEESRKAFKANLENKGKVDDTGLFGFVRHPNYLGYLLWHCGMTLATGSISATISYGIFQFTQFTFSIPELATYMSKKYGDQWTDYQRRVPYRMIPGIY
ncbi:uncharacterized protein BT62DRAFT_94795 [Guyanagaster necrorhizus]|uniref:Steroid 5-alpha reductase C-terminal domain-containing protein n=1 Tax=Guyanagaster necrorhizus TaxID=856835 RepID=A0A9P8AT24_9AGAR|nr:uncharacterized protein BT62DRAFT_94795 [Guyanagaster necrorhizus MCA 3950]KAG7446959.1 hypothetical protein BT62DRAFT_94795 [Guyanagaster necrorhizus MCA 3950]